MKTNYQTYTTGAEADKAFAALNPSVSFVKWLDMPVASTIVDFKKWMKKGVVFTITDGNSKYTRTIRSVRITKGYLIDTEGSTWYFGPGYEEWAFYPIETPKVEKKTKPKVETKLKLNTRTAPKGYIAVKAGRTWCQGCEFKGRCHDANRCSARHRKDKCNVVFVKKDCVNGKSTTPA